MRIVSFNVNGLRAAVRKGLHAWLEATPADVYAFQEIKCDVPTAQAVMQPLTGYHATAHQAEKAGYSGLLLLSRRPYDFVSTESGDAQFDAEARVLRADLGDLTVVNVYVPSGTTGELRQAVKDRFMPHFLQWLNELRRSRPQVVVVGDFNVCHQEIDIHNPKGLQKTSGFLPHERAWLSDVVASGMVDSFRHLYPSRRDYTWWSQRGAARAKNLGWRLDYQFVSAPLAERLADHLLHPEAVFSDHIPTQLVLKE